MPKQPERVSLGCLGKDSGMFPIFDSCADRAQTSIEQVEQGRLMQLLKFGCYLLLLNIVGVKASGLTVISSEKRPYNFMRDGQVVGMSVDVMHAILPHHPPLPITLMPWPRAFDTALKNPDVLIFTMGKTQQRQLQGFVFIGPLSTRNHGLYAFEPKIKPLQSLADVK